MRVVCCFCNISTNVWCHNHSTLMHNSQRHFLDHPEPFKAIWKLSRQSRNFLDQPEIVHTIRKFFRLSGNFPDYPEIFQIIWQLSRQSGNIPDNLETFLTGWKLSGSISRLREIYFWMAIARLFLGLCFISRSIIFAIS